MKQKAARKCSDNTQQDVEQDAFALPVHDFAANIASDEAENDPGEKGHRLVRLSR